MQEPILLSNAIVGELDTDIIESSVPVTDDLKILGDAYGHMIDFNGGILVWVPCISIGELQQIKGGSE